EAEADQREPRLRLAGVDLADLVGEVAGVVELAVIRLDETERLDIIPHAAEVGVVEGVHAVDEEDVDLLAAGRRELLAAGQLLPRGAVDGVQEAHAAGRAEQ